MPRPRFDWNPERVEQLKALWAEGMKTADIAAALGAPSGNAVIGKARRLGLSGNVQAPAIPTNRWPAEKIERLRQLAEAGLCAAEISQALGGPSAGGIRKKALALGIQLKHARPSPPPKPDAPDAPKPAPEDAGISGESIAPTPLADGRLAQVETLPGGHCKWPYGDPRAADFHLCGAKAAGPGEPYCRAHRAIAYRPASNSERRAARADRKAMA